MKIIFYITEHFSYLLGYQDKLIPTPYERNEIGLRNQNKIIQQFQIENANIGVQICYDCEFPFLINHCAQNGMNLLLVPSCTEGTSGITRVNIGAQARALENQIYVLVSSITCKIPGCQIIENSTGFSACYSPPDVGFNGNGIVSKCNIDEACWVIADLDFNKLEFARNQGEVRNYYDSKIYLNH